MINYNYIENQSLEDLNNLGQDDWQIIEIIVSDSPQSFDAFIQKGRTGYNLIEADSSTSFWISNSLDLGDSIVIVFGVILLFGLISKLIYNFIWKKW